MHNLERSPTLAETFGEVTSTEQGLKLLTNASKLSSTSPSHGVRVWPFAPVSQSIASPNSNSGRFVLRSLYFATALRFESGSLVDDQPQRRCVDPLSIIIASLLFVGGGTEGRNGLGSVGVGR